MLNVADNDGWPLGIPEGERARRAQLNITFSGLNGDLPDPVAFDASNADIIRMAQEAIRNGSVPGIKADPDADLSGFEVDRFQATEAIPTPRVFIRPSTSFGG